MRKEEGKRDGGGSGCGGEPDYVDVRICYYQMKPACTHIHDQVQSQKKSINCDPENPFLNPKEYLSNAEEHNSHEKKHAYTHCF